MYIHPFENDHLAVALAFKLRHYGIYGSLMWFMEAIPEVFGVEDSDELDESLQEDAQVDIVEKICSTNNTEDMRQTLLAWLAQCPDAARRDDFVGKAVSKALKVHLAGRK